MNQKTNNRYTILIPKNVAKQIHAIDKNDRLKILEKIKELATSSTSLNIKKLAGLPNLYRLRVGQYPKAQQVIQFASF